MGSQQGFPTAQQPLIGGIVLTLRRVHDQDHKIELLNSHLAFEHCISEINGGNKAQEWGLKLQYLKHYLKHFFEINKFTGLLGELQ